MCAFPFGVVSSDSESGKERAGEEELTPALTLQRWEVKEFCVEQTRRLWLGRSLPFPRLLISLSLCVVWIKGPGRGVWDHGFGLQSV